MFYVYFYYEIFALENLLNHLKWLHVSFVGVIWFFFMVSNFYQYNLHRKELVSH